MITAVDPDFDIVDMPFDDYLNKPVEKRELVGAIERQLTARRYDERLTDYLEVTSKLGLLQAEKSQAELDAHEEVDTLRERAAELKSELDEVLAEFDDAAAAFQEINPD
jgi:DNA-binding response OmpR family regulator